MKTKWLNLILDLTNKIYSQKQDLLSGVGIRIIGDIVSLIFLELILALVSLPLYLGVKTTGVLAFFQEKGAYSKISSDYKLRRVLTVTGVGIVFIIWLVKLLLIVLPPVAYGPLQLYTVSNLSPVEISRQELITQDTAIQTAKTVDTLAVPRIEMVERVNPDKYSITGTGIPGKSVVLFLVEDRTLMYVSDVDNKGNWQVDHLQSDYKLKDGIHSVFAFSYDKDNGLRSRSTFAQYFRVQEGILEKVSQNIDSLSNWTVAILIGIGVFLTFLTI